MPNQAIKAKAVERAINPRRKRTCSRSHAPAWERPVRRSASRRGRLRLTTAGDAERPAAGFPRGERGNQSTAGSVTLTS